MSETPILLRGSTDLNADLYYAVPVGIADPILYAEFDSRKIVLTSVLDRDRVLGLNLGIEVVDPSEFGVDELRNQGRNPLESSCEVALRVCEKFGLSQVVVPPSFPVAFADYLRAGGTQLIVDDARFSERRRVKSATQLDGIRRAQRAADVAMAKARELILELPPGLTSEQVRAAIQAVCIAQGAEQDDDAIVSHGPQSAIGHESGSGEIVRGEPVIVDIWPRDKASRCFADMTRTFVAGGGEPPSELQEYWDLVKRSLTSVLPRVRAGVAVRELWELSCEPFEAAGYPTQRTKKPGELLDRGFFHGLGHGVGLELHEAPHIGRSNDVLVAGDVVTIEPGCYGPGFGGCRLEDLLLVTETGSEILTDFPYEMSLS